MEPAFDDRGDGPVAILLPGYPFDRSMWHAQIDFLSAKGYRAIAPELLGEMDDKLQSVDEPAEACRTMSDMASSVANLMDELKIDQAVVCGLSMGGYVAFEFIHLFPARVCALILAGTRAPADIEQEKQIRLQQVERMLARGMSEIAESSVPKLLSPRTLAERPGVVTHLREMILRADPKSAAAAQRGMVARRDYTDDLGVINMPTLVIVGREDPIRPIADAEFMHKGIRNSRLEIIEDAAHMTNMEQPETFNRAVLSFLRDTV